MSFHEVSFPLNADWGASGGPGFDTNIVVLDSGHEGRFARRNVSRRKYEVGYSVRTEADIAALLSFFIARRGRAYGFRFKDPFDYTSNADGKTTPTSVDQNIGTGDGSEHYFQLRKAYISGSQTVYRIIEKPVDGTVLIAKDSVLLTPNDYFANPTTGLVSFEDAPAVGVVVTAGFEFEVPVRFVEDKLNIVNEHYIRESVPNIPLIELIEPGLTDGEFNYGGAAHLVYSSTLDLTLSMGKVLRLDPTTTNIQVRLPNPATLEYGGPYFYLYRVNLTSDFRIIIANYDGDVIYTLGKFSTTPRCGACIIANIGDGIKRWIFLQ